MLRNLLLVLVFLPTLACAETSSSGVSVSLTITNIPQPAFSISGRHFTAGAAEITVQRAGFRNIQSLGQAGQNYFFAGQRQGRLYEVAVSITGGRITRVNLF
ncbi:MAG: hypothetical protein KGO94_02110 [Alphaproteobacteria bacterium]|nr:hypothetical protein [Alphaproteobacteria bacterium]